MVDAARQMLDELMGRNRNLHPSEASQKVNWEDPEFCQYYIVKFCPHDLFINTRADLGPCSRIHDDEARKMYEESRMTIRKRHYEDEFLRFCNTMLNDVDRKIQKGKQRLLLMNKDKPSHSTSHLSRYQEQLMNLEARIKKLLAEAEEAGIRGDVDQAQDLMIHCERLREERDAFVAQNESSVNKGLADAETEANESSPTSNNDHPDNDKSPKSGEESIEGTGVKANEVNGEKKPANWLQDSTTVMNEKQMEVCETCGAFLIVGDAQQRIEDHLMGKQHLGYSKLRKAVTEIHEKRQKEREEEERRRRDERSRRSSDTERRRDHRERDRECGRDRERDRDRERNRERDRDYRGHSRDYNSRHSTERHHRHNSSKSHGSRSHSRSRSHHNRHCSRDRRDRSGSRSRSRSRY